MIDALPAPLPGDPAQIFVQHRRLLLGVAYRMLGCMADAEEVVQEVFLRLIQHRPDTDRPLQGWLVAVTMNRCRDLLRRSRARTWLPGPLYDAPDVDDADHRSAPLPVAGPEARYTDRQSVRIAFLRAMELLTPDQRAVLVMRDLLGLPVHEVADTLSLSAANVRVLHHRARARMQQVDLAEQPADRNMAALQQFLTCVAQNDITGAAACLAPDAVAITDGDGHRAANVPVTDPLRIARMFCTLAREAGPVDVKLVSCNGQPAVLIVREGTDHLPVYRRKDARHSLVRVETDGEGRIVRVESVIGERRVA